MLFPEGFGIEEHGCILPRLISTVISDKKRPKGSPVQAPVVRRHAEKPDPFFFFYLLSGAGWRDFCLRPRFLWFNKEEGFAVPLETGSVFLELKSHWRTARASRLKARLPRNGAREIATHVAAITLCGGEMAGAPQKREGPGVRISAAGLSAGCRVVAFLLCLKPPRAKYSVLFVTVDLPDICRPLTHAVTPSLASV